MTWLDRLRGAGQGRTNPKSFVSPDGEHVFVLGADAQHEPAILSSGDFSEIRQLVDLTNWDLVAATMDTLGVAMGTSQAAAGFPVDADTLWWFNYDVPTPVAQNLVPGGFSLENQGEMGYDTETYSPDATYCRKIPNGTDPTTRLHGVNTPQFFPGPALDQYTFQVWMNFDADAVLTSWGWNPYIFDCRDANPNGFLVGLSGLTGPGAHSWIFHVGHFFGGAEVDGFLTPVVTTSGWHLVTVTYDSSLAPALALLLYLDDDPTPHNTLGGIFNQPSAPLAGTDIWVADYKLWGWIDEMRMLSRALTPAEIAASYVATTTPAAPVDYEWVMQIIINDEVYAERVIHSGERRRWNDFKAPVRHLTGVCEVCFRLELRQA
ncbi:MAG: LamG-like jellyroll fold domain-containing protein [Thermotogota bacterium]